MFSLSVIDTEVKGSNSGYGQTPRCSEMQQSWQTSHPSFLAVKQYPNVTHEYKNREKWAMTLGDPALLVPPVSPAVFCPSSAIPRLSDYVQLPLYLWIPDYFLPHLVKWMPCPVADCTGVTTRQRWRSGGPRLIHGVHHAMYLHCWDYECKKHPNKHFAGWDNQSLMKLPASARSSFQFVLTEEEGVTMELFNRIVSARMCGSSLTQLRRELRTNRHERMYRAILSYYRHCEDHRSMSKATLTAWMSGIGTTSNEYEDFPPILHNPDAYYDHDPLTVKTMSDIYVKYCKDKAPMWTSYTQQLTANRVSIDATFKVAKKIRNSSLTRCWSMVDIDTGVILHQQMLTHECHDDVLPMLKQYVARCKELQVTMPSRVTSDRGLLDKHLLTHPDAFPDAHINVDNWHFIQLFGKTLNRRSPLYKQAKQEFSGCLYVRGIAADGKAINCHADPESIIEKVQRLLDLYSRSANEPACVTKETREWWNKQIPAIVNNRICSNPLSVSLASNNVVPTVSSSAQENYHRQLNRLTQLVKVSEEFMHYFLLHYMFKWNVDRRRQASLEYDWHTYDLLLVNEAYGQFVRVNGRYSPIWKQPFSLPRISSNPEHFGVLHDHVTLSERIVSASDTLPFSAVLVELLVAEYALSSNVIPHAQKTITEFMDTAPVELYDETKSHEEQTQPVTPSLSVTTECMSYRELNMLQKLYKHDTLMKQLLDDNQWNIAASRWNTFVDYLKKHETLKNQVQDVLHCITGDMIQKGMNALQARHNRQREERTITIQNNHPLISYKAVPASKTKFSEYEKAMLNQQVHNKTDRKTGLINWREIGSVWTSKYTAEMEAGQATHLLPRDIDSLKSMHQTTMRKKKQQEEKTQKESDKAAEKEMKTVTESADDAAMTDEQEVTDTESFILHSNRWQPDAEAHFIHLMNQCRGRWTYAEFGAMWPVVTYGECDFRRWANKTWIVRNKETNKRKREEKKQQKQSRLKTQQ